MQEISLLLPSTSRHTSTFVQLAMQAFQDYPRQDTLKALLRTINSLEESGAVIASLSIPLHRLEYLPFRWDEAKQYIVLR